METYGNHIWLVVEPPLWKMMEFVNWNKMTFPSEWNIKFHGSKPPTSIFIPWTHSSSFIHMETIFRMTMETIWKPYGNHMETIWKPIHIYPLKNLFCPRPLRSGWPRCPPSPSAGRWGLPAISCRRSGCPPRWCDLRWRSTTCGWVDSAGILPSGYVKIAIEHGHL